jgi:hypothetical protein
VRVAKPHDNALVVSVLDLADDVAAAVANLNAHLVAGARRLV